jgi:ATP-dependent Clp protease ATP-binding subunit ClpC
MAPGPVRSSGVRRAIFFARCEASQFGSPYVETEHLLLGILRTDMPLATRLLGPTEKLDLIREQIARQTPERPKIKISVDLPLSHQSKRALAYAAEEAERLHQNRIGGEQLLLGLSREEKSAAAKILARISHGLLAKGRLPWHN